jgi:hypothetical protein
MAVLKKGSLCGTSAKVECAYIRTIEYLVKKKFFVYLSGPGFVCAAKQVFSTLPPEG